MGVWVYTGAATTHEALLQPSGEPWSWWSTTKVADDDERVDTWVRNEDESWALNELRVQYLFPLFSDH